MTMRQSDNRARLAVQARLAVALTALAAITLVLAVSAGAASRTRQRNGKAE
jgi:hypothetical protein